WLVELNDSTDFLFYDSGPNDPERFVIFSTAENLKMLEGNHTFCDGTFDVAPKPFYQVYSMHSLIDGKCLPMVYGLLPNKSQKIYERFLSKIKKALNTLPLSLTCDFEKGLMNAVDKVIKCIFNSVEQLKGKSPSAINRDRIKSCILRVKIIFFALNKIIDLKTEDFKRMIENSNILPEDVLLNKSVQNRNIIYDFDNSKIKIEFDEQKMEDFESHYHDNFFDIVKENRLKSTLKPNRQSPIVKMGRKIPSTLEKPLKSKLGEDTQSAETSESVSGMVECRTISTMTTITDETVTAPDATTSSEATARQINVPGCSNHNDMIEEELEEEKEDFNQPEEIIKPQLMSEFKQNSKSVI
ncbi:hypothetical protein BpHYR1_027233, partial [Brachionus plicatilis]